MKHGGNASSSAKAVAVLKKPLYKACLPRSPLWYNSRHEGSAYISVSCRTGGRLLVGGRLRDRFAHCTNRGSCCQRKPETRRQRTCQASRSYRQRSETCRLRDAILAFVHGNRLSGNCRRNALALKVGLKSPSARQCDRCSATSPQASGIMSVSGFQSMLLMDRAVF